MTMTGTRTSREFARPLALAALAILAASCGRGTATNDPSDSGVVDVAKNDAPANTGGGGAGGAAAADSSGGIGGAGGTASTGGTGGLGGAGGTTTSSGGGGGSGGTGGAGGFGGSAGRGGSAGFGGMGGGGAGCQGNSSTAVYDCFANLSCSAGIVTKVDHSQAFTCSTWPGQCPAGTVVATCQKGCAMPFIGGVIANVRSICKEGVAKGAGATCQVDDDCRPTVAVVTTTEIKNVSLRCDQMAGVCVEQTPNAPSDWLSACSPSVIAAANLKGISTPINKLADPKCSSKICIAAGNDACVRQGCSAACRSDDECPSGSQCKGSTDPFAATKTGYCEPLPTALTCLP